MVNVLSSRHVYITLSECDRNERLSKRGVSWIYDAKSFGEIGIIAKYWLLSGEKRCKACNFIVDEGIVWNLYGI